MNELLMKGMLKMLKNFITPEQIKEGAKGLIKSAIDSKNSIQLDPEKGEITTTAIFYEIEQEVYFALAILNDENQIVRFEKAKKLDEVIDTLIKKL